MGFHLSRGGFPASSRRAFPGSMQVWSYRLSTGEHREPLGFDIQGSVRIPIVDSTTFGTGPLPNIQIKRVKDMPADRTAFRTGIPLVDGHHRPPIPGGFVLQLSDQFAPADIRDRFGQAVILQHVFDRQRLDTHHLVFANETSRQLVQKITTSVGNAGMEFGYLAAGFFAVLRPLLLFGVAPLQPGQALFLFGEEVFVAGLFPRRERHHVLQAQINPNRVWPEPAGAGCPLPPGRRRSTARPYPW